MSMQLFVIIYLTYKLSNFLYSHTHNYHVAKIQDGSQKTFTTTAVIVTNKSTEN